MCILCVEIQKGKMTHREIARAYAEADALDGHWVEVLNTIAEHSDADAVARELSKVYDEKLFKD